MTLDTTSNAAECMSILTGVSISATMNGIGLPKVQTVPDLYQQLLNPGF